MNIDSKLNLDSLAESHKRQLDLMLADKFICNVVGVKLTEVGVGSAKAELELRPEHMNGLGICQGGVLFSLADYAMAAASNYSEESVVSLDVSISYCKSVSSGRLVAEARETDRTRSTTIGDVVVKDDQGRVICIGRSRGYVLRPKR